MPRFIVRPGKDSRDERVLNIRPWKDFQDERIIILAYFREIMYIIKL